MSRTHIVASNIFTLPHVMYALSPTRTPLPEKSTFNPFRRSGSARVRIPPSRPWMERPSVRRTTVGAR